MSFLQSFVVSFLVVILIMPTFISLMKKHNVLDRCGGRKIHKGEKVNLGGIVIFIGFAVALISVFFTSKIESFYFEITFLILLACSVFVGVRDDMNSLSPSSKLILEVAVILFLCEMNIRIDNLYGFMGIYKLNPFVSYALTLFVFIVILNAYNLIDGIDGQATTQALAVFIPILLFLLFIVPFSVRSNWGSVYFWIVICLAIIGALFAFLIFNWEPSKIFMGDTGSITIGIILSSTMIAAIRFGGCLEQNAELYNCPIKSVIGVVFSLFFIPLADTLRVFAYRVSRRRSPMYPDKSHIHHYFIRTGATHKTTALITLSFSLVTSLICIILSLFFNDNILIPILVILFFVYIFALKYITKYRIKKMRLVRHKS